MKKLTIQIKIGKYQFFAVDSIDIKSSWKFQADTATILLSRRLLTEGKLGAETENLESVVKVGDKVKIEAGYHYQFETEFEGYVKSINPDIPIRIECEDAMWLLKQTNYTQAWRKVSLQELLDFIIPEALSFRTTGAVNLGKFRMNNVSAFDVLKKIQEVYSLVSYVRNNEIVVGFPYQEESQKVALNFQQNIDDSKTKLSFRTETQTKLKFRATSIQKDGSKLEYEFGDEGGELRTITLPVGLSQSDIEQVAEQRAKLYKFDGYDGTLTTFGQPYCQHSDVVELSDDLYPDRAGEYLIDTVQVKISSQGYRRTLTLGNKIS